jgi:hypothetical protein
MRSFEKVQELILQHKYEEAAQAYSKMMDIPIQEAKEAIDKWKEK